MKTKTLHFTVCFEGMTKNVSGFWAEGKFEYAMRVLTDGFNLTKEQASDVLNGKKKMVDDPDGTPGCDGTLVDDYWRPADYGYTFYPEATSAPLAAVVAAQSKQIAELEQQVENLTAASGTRFDDPDERLRRVNQTLRAMGSNELPTLDDYISNELERDKRPTPKPDKTYASDNGWVTPDGKFYPCKHAMEHIGSGQFWKSQPETGVAEEARPSSLTSCLESPLNPRSQPSQSASLGRTPIRRLLTSWLGLRGSRAAIITALASLGEVAAARDCHDFAAREHEVFSGEMRNNGKHVEILNLYANNKSERSAINSVNFVRTEYPSRIALHSAQVSGAIGWEKGHALFVPIAFYSWQYWPILRGKWDALNDRPISHLFRRGATEISANEFVFNRETYVQGYITPRKFNRDISAELPLIASLHCRYGGFIGGRSPLSYYRGILGVDESDLHNAQLPDEKTGLADRDDSHDESKANHPPIRRFIFCVLCVFSGYGLLFWSLSDLNRHRSGRRAKLEKSGYGLVLFAVLWWFTALFRSTWTWWL